MSLQKLKETVIINPQLSIFSDNIIRFNDSVLNFIDKSCNKIIDEVDLTENDFIQFNEFINFLSRERIRDFNIVLDYIFSNNTSLDSLLLGYISAIERILACNEKSYDIGKQLTLKFGLCINDNISTDLNEHIKNIKYCYEIRSCIIHGNDNDMFDAPKRHLGINMDYVKKFAKSDKHYKRRSTIIFFAIYYLEENMKVLFKEWIDNPSKIEFLKKN